MVSTTIVHIFFFNYEVTNPVSTQATTSNVTRTYHEPPRHNGSTSTIEVIQYPESVSSRHGKLS